MSSLCRTIRRNAARHEGMIGSKEFHKQVRRMDEHERQETRVAKKAGMFKLFKAKKTKREAKV